MKKTYVLIFLLLNGIGLRAQEYVKKSKSYLYFCGGGGLHSLSYQLENGKRKGAIGYLFNAGYSYFFTPKWGIQAGVGVKSFRSSATLDYMTGKSATDTDGDSYIFRTYYNGWEEKQQGLSLDIPVGIQFRPKLGEKLRLVVTAGGEVSIPVNVTYKVTSGNIETRGYYSQWNVELANMPQHGFTTITTRYEGDVSLKPAYALFADMGVLYGLSPNLDLFIGGYLDYGLNNIIDPENSDVYRNEIYNGVLASSQTDNVTPVAMGLKVGVYWRLWK